MSIPIETVRTDSFSMDYFRFGHGKRTMVILPGLSVQSVMGAAEAVARQYEPLQDDFTIYVFDRRAALPPAYSVREMARDTAAAFEALGLRDICLFGASQGGMIAMVIAIEHPDLMDRMVLGSTSANVKAPQYRVLDSWVRLAREKDSVGLYLDFGKRLYPPAVFDQYREALISAGKTVTDDELERFSILAEGTRDFDVTEQLDKLRCPVLAIGAREDAVLGPDAAAEIAEKLGSRSDFTLFMYSGYGHAAFDTAPDYPQRIRRFFAG